MPHVVDISVLEDVAALLWEAQTLYQGVLEHLREDDQRDALCGVIAVRRALHLRLQDQLARLGHPGAHGAPEAQNDARCISIYRQLTHGDHAGALAEVTQWDHRLRDHVAGRLGEPRLTQLVADNLRFTIQILDAAPAAFTAHHRLAIAS